ncbi:hypothetical protein PGT21_004913 [Puccinia graminis f. sp. tritici]|uniref:Uncharacterized protein n=1 Tax=Puccinia graminis f. sp. tritici TaxID=56615 RepID=A0A5B0LJS3_PUCGR|nr:hypothetical protein PGTUg99_013245 [Puccinia graminis f. sp. tritici]KAA1065573.1 hypothetical protein PGT21_003772 [Puccinia graminis f. sp. tritici]KAA1079991.1 hypothetical protein PGTUg99_019054 [Puccinia graminis f. sp. tritici]KAA1103042.1 hypothetical protein PGT21_004913 [Puccinia graminis f. sp. tritici]
MIPKTILFVIFTVISSVATGTSVACANKRCNATAAQMLSHSYPKEAKCGEPLGNEECEEERHKVYYSCDKCGSITVKNRVIHRDELAVAPCTHKAKALFSTPSNPPPTGAASHSRAASEATSSEGGLPYEIIDGRKFYTFV